MKKASLMYWWPRSWGSMPANFDVDVKPPSGTVTRLFPARATPSIKS
jgi:hypothetical protein